MEVRQKPFELKVYEALAPRKHLASSEKRKMVYLQRGYEGEMYYDRLLEESLPGEYLLLKDTWLTHHNKAFQIDTGLLIGHTFYLYEVKNQAGEYYYEDDKLWHISGTEVDNPLIQLKRTTSLFRQFLQYHRFSVPLQSAVVFVNDAFTLFQAPKHSSMILPTQVKRYLQQQFQHSTPIHPIFPELYEKIETLKLERSPFETLPAYQYHELAKGIPCKKCGTFISKLEGKRCVCLSCRTEEKLQSAILRCIQDFTLLFPNHQVTRNTIHEWCGGLDVKRRISYVLQQHFTKKKNTRAAYYQ